MRFIKSLFTRFNGITTIKNVADELPPPSLIEAELEDDVHFFKNKLEETARRYDILQAKTIH